MNIIRFLCSHTFFMILSSCRWSQWDWNCNCASQPCSVLLDTSEVFLLWGNQLLSMVTLSTWKQCSSIQFKELRQNLNINKTHYHQNMKLWCLIFEHCLFVLQHFHHMRSYKTIKYWITSVKSTCSSFHGLQLQQQNKVVIYYIRYYIINSSDKMLILD